MWFRAPAVLCRDCSGIEHGFCLSGVLVPADGYWQPSPESEDLQKCPYQPACKFPGRQKRLLAVQQSAQLRAKASSSGIAIAGGALDVEFYLTEQCAEGCAGGAPPLTVSTPRTMACGEQVVDLTHSARDLSQVLRAPLRSVRTRLWAGVGSCLQEVPTEETGASEAHAAFRAGGCVAAAVTLAPCNLCQLSYLRLIASRRTLSTTLLCSSETAVFSSSSFVQQSLASAR